MPEVTDGAKRIVLIHATPVATAPVHVAFGQIWPEAELVDLLDTGLTLDRQRAPELTEDLIDRFVTLAGYGHRIGAQAILVTCSAFGPAIERAAAVLPIPVLKPNEAMFRAALAAGSRIAMLATFAPAVGTMSHEFDCLADADATLDTVVVEGAMEALRRGDETTHNRLVAAAAAGLVGYDAVMLAHFSTARAAAAVRAVIGPSVVTAPHAAVNAVRAALTVTN